MMGVAKYSVGDKVIPISKSVGSSFENSEVIQKMKELKQEFLYIAIGMDKDGEYRCNVNKDKSEGHYFKEHDLIPYVEKVEKPVYKLNDKLRILGKSVGISFDDSLVLAEARERGQDFLYFKNTTPEGDLSLVSSEDGFGGDHFTYEDVELYIEPVQEEVNEVETEIQEEVAPRTIIVKELIELYNRGILKPDDTFCRC